MSKEEDKKSIDPQKITGEFNGKKAFDFPREEKLVERLDSGVIRIDCRKYGENSQMK